MSIANRERSAKAIPCTCARRGSTRALLSFPVLFLVAAVVLTFGTPEERRISVYSSAANYSLPVAQRNGIDYVGLLEILEPLGAVTAKVNGPHWRFRYEKVESEFMAGKTHARVGGHDLDLPAAFLLENTRGLVSLSSLSALLPRFLGGPVTFHETARRLFIGDIAVHFTAQVSGSNPPKLVMDFTAPVNPMIATEPGKLRMVFTHEPVVAPGSQTLTFDSKIIPSATYHEDNGAVVLEVNSTSPVMASFSNNGRTITIGPPPSPSATVAQTPAPAKTPSSAPETPQLLATTAAPAVHRYFAVVDASHGGDERGAALSDQLAEKDVTLAFARYLRQELESRGMPTLLVRNADVTIGLDPRAAMANAAQAAIYLCVHAASQGNEVRLYTAMLPSGGQNQGPFLDWNTAQTGARPLSLLAATSLATELRSRQIPVRSLTAALRPLNNITTAAVAIEIAPPSTDISQMNSPGYLQAIASSVAAGLANVRDKLVVSR
jgi:N-acetylmuramoyl-L-alanine amidase